MTSSRANERMIRAHDRADETATAGRVTAITAVTTNHGDHGGHGRPRRSRPATADTAGHGRTFQTGVTADAANAALANDTVARLIRVNERANGRIERSAPPGTRPRRRRGGSRRGRGHGGHSKHCRSRQSRPPKAERSGAGSRPRRHGDHGAHASPGSPVPCGVAAADHTESRLARRVTAGTDGHGVLGGSPGVCRRRVRGDVLTYQGTWLRPAGEAPTYPSKA